MNRVLLEASGFIVWAEHDDSWTLWSSRHAAAAHAALIDSNTPIGFVRPESTTIAT